MYAIQGQKPSPNQPKLSPPKRGHLLNNDIFSTNCGLLTATKIVPRAGLGGRARIRGQKKKTPSAPFYAFHSVTNSVPLNSFTPSDPNILLCITLSFHGTLFPSQTFHPTEIPTPAILPHLRPFSPNLHPGHLIPLKVKLFHVKPQVQNQSHLIPFSPLQHLLNHFNLFP